MLDKIQITRNSLSRATGDIFPYCFILLVCTTPSAVRTGHNVCSQLYTLGRFPRLGTFLETNLRAPPGPSVRHVSRSGTGSPERRNISEFRSFPKWSRSIDLSLPLCIQGAHFLHQIWAFEVQSRICQTDERHASPRCEQLFTAPGMGQFFTCL